MALALYGGAALGQEHVRQPTEGTSGFEVIVVTGSYIAGAAEDAALPIDVLTADELLKQGSPSVTELIKALPSVARRVRRLESIRRRPVDRFVQRQSARPWRPAHAGAVERPSESRPIRPISAGVDINLFPTAAIERIEVLKDGAAATYGSDAIAGVVNFITRRNFEGLQIDGSL